MKNNIYKIEFEGKDYYLDQPTVDECIKHNRTIATLVEGNLMMCNLEEFEELTKKIDNKGKVKK